MSEFRLTRYELQLMDVLWTLGEGSVQDVCSRLERDLAYTTVMTTLNILVARKGVLEREKRGRAFIYKPLVSREEISRSILVDLKSVLFGKRLPSLVLSLMSDVNMSQRDADIIEDAIRKLEQEQ